MRTVLIVMFRAALAISGASMIYLLFVFGHTEDTPLGRILAAAAVAGVSALIAGMLQWIGLPAEPKDPAQKKQARGR